MEKCSECAFFVADSKMGRCRRHEPRLVVFENGPDTQIGTYWPLVAASDFCGDFRPRGQESDKR